MHVDDLRKVENAVVVKGLNGLVDPDLIPVMARLINEHPGYHDPHDFYLGLLNECDQKNRREMYDVLKPYLNFEPWPLETYIIKLKDQANAIASKSEPIEVGIRKFVEARPMEATGAVAELRCFKCTRMAKFYGDTPVQAVIEARKAGWVRDVAEDREICPKCPAIRKKWGSA